MNNILTIEDLEPEGKTVFVRVDINCPIDGRGMLLDLSRIEEATVTLRDLSESKVVVGSHQGRAGRSDYISLNQHAEALTKMLGKEVKFIEDIFGPAAKAEIAALKRGEILLLDNLRFLAEEGAEYSPEEAARTFFVQRLVGCFDACVLDAFPTAHRSHPSIVGFSHLLPACGGRLVVKELKSLSRILTVSKGPFTAVLGGKKVQDRLEAIETLILQKRADRILLTGVVGNVFLKASGRISGSLGIDQESGLVEKARSLMVDFPDVFELPVDAAVCRDEARVEIDLKTFKDGEAILDIGSKTIDQYERIIRSSGTIFMSGPAGVFERKGFGVGTESMLRAMSSSFGTTIVSGGHLNAALQRFGIRDFIDHVSTAGGALVLYLAGRKLPLIDALQRAYERVKGRID